MHVRGHFFCLNGAHLSFHLASSQQELPRLAIYRSRRALHEFNTLGLHQGQLEGSPADGSFAQWLYNVQLF